MIGRAYGHRGHAELPHMLERHRLAVYIIPLSQHNEAQRIVLCSSSSTLRTTLIRASDTRHQASGMAFLRLFS